MAYRYGGRNIFSMSTFSISSAAGMLIIINVAVFMLQHFFGARLIELFGLTPYLVIKRFHIYQLASYLFLHGSFLHLLFNMFMLWMFGMNVERAWGRREFLKYYFLTGIGAGILYVAFSPFSLIPSIGASGAIYGLMVAFAMMYPDAVIYLYFLFPVKAKHLVIFFAVFEFVASFSHNTGVANIAHFGGMLAGYLYLKFSFNLRIMAKSWKHSLSGMFKRRVKIVKQGKPGSAEVDEILEKILLKGAGSLTEREKKIMDEYTRKKRGWG